MPAIAKVQKHASPYENARQHVELAAKELQALTTGRTD